MILTDHTVNILIPMQISTPARAEGKKDLTGQIIENRMERSRGQLQFSSSSGLPSKGNNW